MKLVNQIHEKLNAEYSMATIQEIIETAIEVIKKNDKTMIKNFGTFYWKSYPERTGRNPKTGEEVNIPPRTLLRFKSKVKYEHK